MAKKKQKHTDLPEEMREDITEIENTKHLRRLMRRRKLRKFRWIIWVFVMVPIVYLAVQVFIILAPRMRTEVALLNTMTDMLPVKGQVVHSSAEVRSEGEHIYYTVDVGQRVAQDAEVGLVFGDEGGVQQMYRLDALNEEIEMLRDAQATSVQGMSLESLLTERREGIYALLEQIETKAYTGAEPYMGQVAFATNRMQILTGQEDNFEARITTLTAERDRIQAQLNPIATITSPQAGYFVPQGSTPSAQLNYERITNMTPKAFETAINNNLQNPRQNIAGYVVTDYTWHFFTTVELRLADRFVVGDKSLRLCFTDVSDEEIPVTVQSVKTDDASGLALVELMCEYVNPEILGLRTEKAEIIFGRQRGLRIERGAMRLLDVENEDGSMTTYQGVYVQFGNMVYFRRIEILVQDEQYILVPEEYQRGVSEVRLYDTVIVDSGGVELYDSKIL